MNNLSKNLQETDLNRRRKQIIGMATGAKLAPRVIEYLPHENMVWKTVSTALRPVWDATVADEVLEAREIIGLPIERVPQLIEVSDKLAGSSGFTFHAVPGLVDAEAFFGALARKSFLSTQYLRHPKSPLYTPEPDIIHEVIGHGTCLANPKLAQLHLLAGQALVRVKKAQSKQFISNVWWFSGEFGVIRNSRGLKAFGAGLLSSIGELEFFAKHAQILDLDIQKMGTTPYRIDEFQKVLFAANSIDHLLEVVGGFFKHATDEDIAKLLSKND